MLRAPRLNPYKPKRRLEQVESFYLTSLLHGDLDDMIPGLPARREVYDSLRAGKKVVLPNGDELHPLSGGQKFMLYSVFEE